MENENENLSEKPVMTLRFRSHPLWNELLGNGGKGNFSQWLQIKTWRKRGELRAVEFFNAQNVPLTAYSETRTFKGKERKKDGFCAKEPYIKEPCIIVIKTYLNNNRVFDVHNLAFKPLLDGFRDANVYPDDSWKIVRGVFPCFGGVRKNQIDLLNVTYEFYLSNKIKNVQGLLFDTLTTA